MSTSALHGLYAITDAAITNTAVTPYEKFADAIEQALAGGARLLQYRDKSHDSNKRLQHCVIIAELCDQHNALFIVNDDIELAHNSKANGVHLGKDDAALTQARNKLGTEAIIGISCYNQLSLAAQAQLGGADYVAFGAFFHSPTKPAANTASIALLQQAKRQLNIPVCAIGGITANNASTVIHQGADMIAVISDVFGSNDINLAAINLTKQFSVKAN